MGRQIRPEIVGAARPFVDGASPVATRVVKAAGGDLDQSFVEARVRTLTIWHPIALPGLVRFPVAAAVEQLDALFEASCHRRDNRSVTGAPLEYSRVNLSSDPIYRYLRITKGGQGGVPGEAAEQDLLDGAWLQRLRRIHQLQSAWWVFATAEHSRFQHALGAMHLAGEWAHHLYPTLSASCKDTPSLGLVVETMRIAGLLHDVGHGPFGHFFDENYLDTWGIDHEVIGRSLVTGPLA